MFSGRGNEKQNFSTFGYMHPSPMNTLTMRQSSVGQISQKNHLTKWTEHDIWGSPNCAPVLAMRIGIGF